MKRIPSWLVFAGILFSAVSCSSIQPEDSTSVRPVITNAADENIKRRDEIESKMMRGEYLHDGAMELASLGDIDSVPALLVVLKENPAQPNGVMECTTGHALTTLKALTGAHPGTTYEAWLKWWNKYKKNHAVSGRLEK